MKYFLISLITLISIQCRTKVTETTIKVSFLDGTIDTMTVQRQGRLYLSKSCIYDSEYGDGVVCGVKLFEFIK